MSAQAQPGAGAGTYRPATPDIEAQPLAALRYAPPNPDAIMRITSEMPRRQVAKFHAFWHSDTWERAQAAREAKLSECTKSVAMLLNTARQHKSTSGGRVCATVLASLYNGERVKFDLSDLKRLDMDLFEHALNTMRVCYELSMEPHQFLEDGGRLIEEMIADWGLEKKKRRRA